MKIKTEQIDAVTRNTLALAVELYSHRVMRADKAVGKKYLELSNRIRHGEVLLCEYQYPEQQEGGEE